LPDFTLYVSPLNESGGHLVTNGQNPPTNEDATAAVSQRATSRRRAAYDRDCAAVKREAAAANRDHAQADNDQRAMNREHAAGVREQAASGRDADASRRDRTQAAAEGQTGNQHRDREQAAADRESAASDRERTASDRVSSQVEAQERTSSRGQAAADRKHAAADRIAASCDQEYMRTELRLAGLDPVTGAVDRWAGLATLERDVARARRGNGLLVLAYIDVDELTQINGEDGRAAGDRVLRNVANAVHRHLRQYDTLVRLGQNEFLCGLGNCTSATAQSKFRAIRSTLAETQVQASFSVGYAELRLNEALDQLTARAKLALYAAKQSR
jgi:diguanylate cyclase (GGDEF)-like protein